MTHIPTRNVVASYAATITCRRASDWPWVMRIKISMPIVHNNGHATYSASQAVSGIFADPTRRLSAGQRHRMRSCR